MLKIRLRRGGAKKRPSYRIVVAEASAPRDGAFKEIIGRYNPLTDPSTVVLDEERYRDWLSKGAQPTPGLLRVLTRAGMLEGTPREARPESDQAAQAPAEETEEAAESETAE